MSLPYFPSQSLAAKLIAFFTRHSAEELSSADISEKFDVPLRDVTALLTSAVTAGVFTRVAMGRAAAGVHTYGAGKVLLDHLRTPSVSPAQASQPEAPAPQVRSTQRSSPPPVQSKPRRSLPPLDFSKIKVDEGIPVFTRSPSRKGTTAYDGLFSKLTKANTSAAAPMTYKKAIASAARTFMKSNPGFKITVTNDAENVANCRVHRLA